MLYAVIMAGGSGTRFWPQSRERLPKQFLTLAGRRSLLQSAFDRIASLTSPERVLIVTNVLQREKTLEQLPELAPDQVVGEPCGRDTAACIGLAAELIRRRDPDAHLIVLAADHLISPIEDFHRAVRAADELLADEPRALVTFGIPPQAPSTAYGYLSRDAAAGPKRRAGVDVYPLLSFHEKPKLEVAEEFAASGTHYWNSGIFAWRAATISEEIRKRQPATAAACARIAEAWPTANRDAVFAKEYEGLTKISIDFAVMEKTDLPIYMVQAPFTWDDVGSWLALERIHAPDAAGNVALGEHVGVETDGCIVVGAPGHVVTTLGVRDLIVVHTPDATLVADRRQEQSVKKLLEALRERGLLQYL
jgi:mannose-1-phosphate guanylyltransferase